MENEAALDATNIKQMIHVQIMWHWSVWAVMPQCVSCQYLPVYQASRDCLCLQRNASLQIYFMMNTTPLPVHLNDWLSFSDFESARERILSYNLTGLQLALGEREMLALMKKVS